MYYNYIVRQKTGSADQSFCREYLIFPFVLIFLSFVIFLVNTDKGIGIYPDTTRYMGITEQRYDAPLYAWLVQSPALMGFDMVRAAKALGSFFVCANTLMIWRLLVGATGKPRYAAMGTALIVLSPQFVTQHSLAMSEPLFLFWLLIVLLLALRFLETENRTWLVASAIALGLATLSRFTAPPMGAAIATYLLLDPRRSFKHRLGDAVLYGLVSAAIFLAWVAVSTIVTGHSIGRELRLHGNMGTQEWMNSLGTLAAWLLPDNVPFAVRVLFLCAFAVAAGTLIFVQSARMLNHRPHATADYSFLPLILGLFFVFYLGFMVLATSIEANLSLNGRYAFPVYVTTAMAITAALPEFRTSRGLLRVFHHGLAVLAITVLCSHATRSAVRSLEAYRSGIGYASLAWVNSPTMRAVGELPEDALIYSNGADAIAYVLKRPAAFIPEWFDLRTGVENAADPLYLQLSRLNSAAEKRPTYIVMFDNITWRFYRVSEADLKQLLSLIRVATTPDGRIYEVPRGTPKD